MFSNMKGTKKQVSKYIMPRYEYVFFNKKLAEQYQPILYLNKSGRQKPDGIYYRIVAEKSFNDICIQYFFHWKNFTNIWNPGKYEYRPVYVFLKSFVRNPYMVVYEDLAPIQFGFRKVTIHHESGSQLPKIKIKRYEISEAPYYPFGGKTKKKFLTPYQILPKRSHWLQFEGDRPKLGIIAGVYLSGKRNEINGSQVNPPLKKLEDKILDEWYFKNVIDLDERPFLYDISSPFRTPFIKRILIDKKSKKQFQDLFSLSKQIQLQFS